MLYQPVINLIHENLPALSEINIEFLHRNRSQSCGCVHNSLQLPVATSRFGAQVHFQCFAKVMNRLSNESDALAAKGLGNIGTCGCAEMFIADRLNRLRPQEFVQQNARGIPRTALRGQI